MLTEAIQEWLGDRRIEPEIALRLGATISVDRDGGEVFSLPYVVAGNTVNHKHRRIPKDGFRMDPDQPLVLWNFDVITDPSLTDQPLVITEGEMDAMSAIQTGWVRTVSVPNGAPSEKAEDQNSRRYAFLEHAMEAMRPVKEIILACDNDGPGQALMNDLAVRLGKGRCKFITYPLNREKTRRLKDLNEVLITYGDRGVDQTLKGAKWFKVSGVYLMSEIAPKPHQPGITTGFPFLDSHYRVRLGDLCVVTGIPSMGKTSWLNDFGCRMAEKHGWVIAYGSFEQDPQKDHKRALVEWYASKPHDRCAPVELVEAENWIDEHFVFIKPDDEDVPDLKWTMDRIATCVVRYNAKMAIIDPWNELEHVRDRHISETEYVGIAIRELKALANRLNIHLVIAAHPTKIEQVSGEYPMPSLYQINGSANWYNKPDIGIIIHRPDKSGNMSMINVEKVRYHDQIGKPGIEWMVYDFERRRYSHAAPPEEVEDARKRKGRSA